MLSPSCLNIYFPVSLNFHPMSTQIREAAHVLALQAPPGRPGGLQGGDGAGAAGRRLRPDTARRLEEGLATHAARRQRRALPRGARQP